MSSISLLLADNPNLADVIKKSRAFGVFFNFFSAVTSMVYCKVLKFKKKVGDPSLNYESENSSRKEDYRERALLMGRNLRALRQRFGITETELARKLHTSVPVVSQLERGIRAIGPGLMIRLTRFFNVDETYFLQKPTNGLERSFDAVGGYPGPKKMNLLSWESIGKLGKDITLGAIKRESQGAIVEDMTGAAWFAVRVKKGDDSMEPEYRKDDIMVVNAEINPMTGDDAIVLLNGEAMCRKVIFKDDRVVMKAYNPEFVDISFPKTERGKSFEIVGRVMEIRRPRKSRVAIKVEDQ